MRHLAHDRWNAPRDKVLGDMLEDTEEYQIPGYVASTGYSRTELLIEDEDGLDYARVASLDGLFGSLNLTEPT